MVAEQGEMGIDIVSDGEQSKPDYSTYIKDRFTGFEGPPSEAMDVSRDRLEFPDYTAGNRPGRRRGERPSDLQRAHRLA